ncbi:hypothetical protein AAHA92_10363 [Salvia divinorum]|uniref:Uncharacterized protein n=1 Tax=Salvia divinorum TaxID=28513 RepID=A0ABD1HX02_SALDI
MITLNTCPFVLNCASISQVLRMETGKGPRHFSRGKLNLDISRKRVKIIPVTFEAPARCHQFQPYPHSEKQFNSITVGQSG